MNTNMLAALRRGVTGALSVGALLAALPVHAQKVSTMSTPTIDCGVATQVSLPIIFTAGSPTGAPAGFSLQWMTEADFIANGGWFLSSDPALCKGSFSGNASGHVYNLDAAPPNNTAVVQIGDAIFDNPGASSNCASEPLACDTTYVFRAFSHANRSLFRSAFTPDRYCMTLACDPVPGCTFTQGYWKTHGPIPTGNNQNEWPVTSLVLGNVSYTDHELLSIFNKPAAGNGLIALAHQVIAVELNIANGADGSAIATALAAAHALIGNLVIPPVGTGSLHSSLTSGLTATLTSYNEGAIGPGHCS